MDSEPLPNQLSHVIALIADMGVNDALHAEELVDHVDGGSCGGLRQRVSVQEAPQLAQKSFQCGLSASCAEGVRMRSQHCGLCLDHFPQWPAAHPVQ